ncbi:MAG TPA: DUF4118 domain-containing protein, partial [Bryobacteraceae bacterium]|nr:DUF4118 domain-containing protein [Bryobacteraceae bacterium]
MLKSTGGRYAVAAVAFAAAFAIRGAMSPELGDTARYMVFMAAVMFGSWYGGFGPGLLVTALSAITTQFFLPPPGFQISNLADALDLLLFIIIGVFISILNQQRHSALDLAAGSVESFQRESRERERMQASEAETRRWARDTLSSIGDAVICTDSEGMITYMNSVALELTGWPLEDAKAKPLRDVFTIIDEETRSPVPSPLGRILEGSRTLGLGAHTILVARSGKEIPIDDSGAPIRDVQRQIIGAVLVFRDISDRRQVETGLRSLAAELASSNADLADYAYAISHDLQEPLRAMGVFSQLLQRKYRDRLDSDADQYLEFIASGVDRMSRM